MSANEGVKGSPGEWLALMTRAEEACRTGDVQSAIRQCGELEALLAGRGHPLETHLLARIERVRDASRVASDGADALPVLPDLHVDDSTQAKAAREERARLKQDQRTQWESALALQLDRGESWQPPPLRDRPWSAVPAEADVARDNAVCRLALREALTALSDHDAPPLRVCEAHPEFDVAEALTQLLQGHGGSRRLARNGMTTLGTLEAASRALIVSPHPKHRERPLWAWQREALVAWTSHGRRGVVEAVTGTGKTRVGVEAIRDALAHGMGAVVSVPGKSLMDQWFDALDILGIRVDRLGDNMRGEAADGKVLVGIVHSLARHPPRPSVARNCLLVVDECHRSGAETFAKSLLDEYPHRLGLTATFERGDYGMLPLKQFFGGGPVFRIGYQRAIQDNVVAHYAVATIGVDFTPLEREVYQDAEDRCRTSRRWLIANGVTPRPFGEYMAEVARISKDPEDRRSSCARDYLVGRRF